ncbi:SMI1/KNR4 family protein [Kribbella deserti]|uniref:SMI1/KNR4 family protein n=1 Tax=Kribbella deserti TaxID=1926257 RepID=A0ABV6QTU8_9ACTN
MPRSVTASWALIAEWLAANLPAAMAVVQAPASAEQIAQVEAAMERPLPADMVEWLRLADGMHWQTRHGSLLPTLHNPMGCEEILSHRDMLHSVYGRRPRPEDNDPAGTPVGEWLDAFLPMGNAIIGLTLFLDLRDGSRYGGVCEWDPEAGGFVDEPRWDSVAHLFAEVADALTTGAPVMSAYAAGGRGPGDRLPAMIPDLSDPDYLSWEGELGT